MAEEDKGRQVPYHRSGGRISVVGGGRSSLALAAMLAMTASLPTVQAGTRREVDWWGDRKEPDNRGRRAEKDAIALEKAEAKRQRKAAKRAAKVGAQTTASDWHN